MDNHQLKEFEKNWDQACPNYQSRALVHGAVRVYLEQEKRLEQLRGQLDAQSWSPQEWS